MKKWKAPVGSGGGNWEFNGSANSEPDYSSISFLPLAPVLKRSIVFAAGEGIIPRIEAHRLINALGLKGA